MKSFRCSPHAVSLSLRFTVIRPTTRTQRLRTSEIEGGRIEVRRFDTNEAGGG